ncbi:MAG: hypothetical protein WDN75_00395 [Bacteroidota bacterium]
MIIRIFFGWKVLELSGKRAVEYSFRNSANGETTSIVLRDYDFTFRKGKEVEVISYANIVAVRISRTSGKNFRMYLYPDDHSPLVIPAVSFSENGKPMDQSREYAMLVRVLHHHLKDKSKAVFSSGGNSDKIWQWAAVSAVFSFIISIIADYLGFGLMNVYIQASVLTLMAVTVVVALNARNLPKTYQPTDIPLQFLP